jgi:hypothetical protein
MVRRQDGQGEVNGSRGVDLSRGEAGVTFAADVAVLHEERLRHRSGCIVLVRALPAKREGTICNTHRDAIRDAGRSLSKDYNRSVRIVFAIVASCMLLVPS